MRAPAVSIVAAFVAGIVLGSSLEMLPTVWVAMVVALLLAALGCLRREFIWTAWIVGLSAWLLLGALAASLEHAEHPTNSVASLISSGRLETNAALRWSGRLREDPVHLPGGIRYDVDLEKVQTGDKVMAVSGGLRANLYTDALDPETPVRLRAGDRAEFLVRARVPRNYRDLGAFDMRTYYERQQIHLLGTVRAAALIQWLDASPPTMWHRLARLRGQLLEELDTLFGRATAEAAILRAMLLGDRGFLDQEVAVDFQRTAVYHVLVVAGLHVAALTWFVMWLTRRLRLRMEWRIAMTLVALAVFVGVVEDRPPILRAALMAAVALVAMTLYRRVEPTNTVSVAALAILIFKPSALTDPSFQLSFLAVGAIAAVGVPWVERSSEPYRRALAHLGDVTRDPAHAARAAQFRLDARAAVGWLESRLPPRLAARAALGVTVPCAAAARLWEMCLISLVLQVGMLPLLARDFHRVSLSGMLANVPAALLTGLIVPVGFLTLGAGLLWRPLAAPPALLLGWLADLLAETVRWFAHWPRLSYRIPGPPQWLLAIFFSVLVLLGIVAHASRRMNAPARSAFPARSLSGRGRPEWGLAVVLIILTIGVATFPFAPQLQRGRLEATVLDVGQGDAIFLAFPDGRTMLVDGGGLPTFGHSPGVGYERSFDVGEQVVSPYLWERGLKHIDVVVLSHAHEDHIGGLGAVVENFHVGELWVGRDVTSPAFRKLLAEAAARYIPVLRHHRGDSFSWNTVKIRVLWPEDSAPAAQGTNNDSLVLRLDDRSVAFVLPGDIERGVEEKLVAAGDQLRAEFLKVAHHGSRTSSTDGFLGAVVPRVEVISVGEGNSYGHPNAEVLARLEGRGARLLRTDRDGAVTAITDGHTLQVRSFAEELKP